MDLPGRTMDLPGRTLRGRTLRGCLPVLALQLLASLSWGPGVEAECMVRVYYNLSAAVPSFVDQVCDVACCGHYPNVYCCNQCDSTFRNADGHLGSGAVTGIVLGILIGLVTLFVIFVYVYGKWRRDKDPVGRAMYRLYRMSTRRRRRPKPQTGQDGQTIGPSTIPISNGGTQNRAFSEGQGNYPRSRRRTPGTAETPMQQDQLSKPPRPGHRDPIRPTDPAHPREGPVSGDPGPKPSTPALELLDTRGLEKQSNTNQSRRPIGADTQGNEHEKDPIIHQPRPPSDDIKPYSGHSDKAYQALGKRPGEHPYTTPYNVNQRDKYDVPRDSGDRYKLKSETRLGPPSQPHQYSGESKTSHPDGNRMYPPDRNTSYPSDRQTSQPQNKHTSHPSDRHTSHPSHPPDKNTSYPSDRHTSHPSDRQTSHPLANTNKDTSYQREPHPSYPSTNNARGGPGYPPYTSTPGRGAPPRQPEYKETPIRQGDRDYRQTNGDRGVVLGYPGGSRQSQI